MPTLAATAATMATEAGAPPRRLPRPLCNRVTPRGDIVAHPARYDEATAVFGNRGVLHDAHRRLVRTSATRAWLSCRLRVQRTRKVQRDDVRSASNHRSDTRTSRTHWKRMGLSSIFWPRVHRLPSALTPLSFSLPSRTAPSTGGSGRSCILATTQSSSSSTSRRRSPLAIGRAPAAAVLTTNHSPPLGHARFPPRLRRGRPHRSTGCFVRRRHLSSLRCEIFRMGVSSRRRSLSAPYGGVASSFGGHMRDTAPRTLCAPRRASDV